MFQILQKNQGGINEEYSYLFTHPIPKERITDARIRETSVDDKKPYRNQDDSKNAIKTKGKSTKSQKYKEKYHFRPR